MAMQPKAPAAAPRQMSNVASAGGLGMGGGAAAKSIGGGTGGASSAQVK